MSKIILIIFLFIIIVVAIGYWFYEAVLMPQELEDGLTETEKACINYGGQVVTSLCCQSAGDFPNLCVIGPCGCSPDNSHQIKICDCGENKCWDGKKCVVFGSENILGSDAKNSTYTIDGEKVTLENGYSEQEIMPGSAIKIETRIFGEPIRGDVSGDNIDDDVVLLTYNPGGTGTFYYVAAAVKEETGYSGSNAVFIGDRIAPQVTMIEDGMIIVNYADRYPWESFVAETSVAKSKYLIYEQGQLEEIPRPVLSQDAALSLVEDKWGDCSLDLCDKLTVNILDGKDGVWYVEARYDGLRDDSVQSEIKTSGAFYVNNTWVLGNILRREYRCQLGRGHQDFSTELCI